MRSGLLEKYTTLELGSDAVDALFLNDINTAVDGVKSIFGKDFDSFPLPCRAALIDIQFNTGSVNHLPTVVHAAKGTGPFAGKSASERWLAAATASNRPDASSERNNLIANWFRGGAAQAKLKKP